MNQKAFRIKALITKALIIIWVLLSTMDLWVIPWISRQVGIESPIAERGWKTYDHLILIAIFILVSLIYDMIKFFCIVKISHIGKSDIEGEDQENS